MQNLMPIGEFASALQLSQKALRLYAENALLPPVWVDPDSGYRYEPDGPPREIYLNAADEELRREIALPLR